MMKRALVVVAAATAVAIPSVALAQQSRPEVYIGFLPTTTTVAQPTTTTLGEETTTTTLAEEVKGQVEVQPPQAAQVDPAASLPVTGGDVLGLVAIGAGLVAIGAGLSRARRRSTQS